MTAGRESEDWNRWGFDSCKQSGDNPRTGYVLKKFIPEADVPLSWQTVYIDPWPHFRLAEIYLIYAEAQFELGNEAIARGYLSRIRARADMPPIPASVSGSALRERIYNERRIELAFAGHRFFDTRKWLIAELVENTPIQGMDIIKNTQTGLKAYRPLTLLVKAPYQDRMNLLPVATAESGRNPWLTQTPGW